MLNNIRLHINFSFLAACDSDSEVSGVNGESYVLRSNYLLSLRIIVPLSPLVFPLNYCSSEILMCLRHCIF